MPLEMGYSRTVFRGSLEEEPGGRREAETGTLGGGSVAEHSRASG